MWKVHILVIFFVFLCFFCLLLFSAPSHLIHCPFLPWETTFAHLAACSCQRTSSTMRPRRWDGVALCQDGLISPSPRTLLHYCTWPTTSQCLRADFAWCVAADGVHFLLVARVRATGATYGSQDSFSVISSLTLVHLYSSVRPEMGSSKMPFL